jgi:hypothetical protein
MIGLDLRPGAGSQLLRIDELLADADQTAVDLGRGLPSLRAFYKLIVLTPDGVHIVARIA